jgi:flagellar capping protein FliD
MAEMNFHKLPMDAIDILGSVIAGETGGAAGGGFDTSFLIDAASELAKRGVSTYESKQASEKSRRDAEAQLQRAVAADQAWAAAERDLELATLSRDAGKVAAARAMVDLSASDARSAGAGLPQDKINQRVAAAANATKSAASAAMGAPGDASKQAALHAWQKVAAAAAAPAPAAPGQPGGLAHHGGGASLFSRVPTWGWIAGGATVVIGAALLIFRRR